MTNPGDGAPEPDEHRLVGSRLREARDVLGLTQEDVATALGIPRTSVIAMEAGRRKVTGVELRRLARLYRRSVAWLLGDEPDPSEVLEAEALYRATASLTDEDREQVLRFAQFLAAGGPSRTGGPARQAPPVTPGARRGRVKPQGR